MCLCHFLGVCVSYFISVVKTQMYIRISLLYNVRDVTLLLFVYGYFCYCRKCYCSVVVVIAGAGASAATVVLFFIFFLIQNQPSSNFNVLYIYFFHGWLNSLSLPLFIITQYIYIVII